MTTFAQFSFICMIVIGFVLAHLWLILSPTPNADRALRWFVGVLVLAIFFLPIALFIYEFPSPSEWWLRRALTSPILVMALIGLLSGFLARTTVSHLQDWRSTLVYGVPPLLLVLLGLFSADVTTFMRRVRAVQTQYISLSLSPEIPAKSTPEVQYPWTQAFKGQPFSMGVRSLSALIGVPPDDFPGANPDNNGALQRDLAFIESCVLPSTSTANTRCPHQLQSTAQEATNLRKYIKRIEPLTKFRTLAKCLADHAGTYPNGLPIQADLYNLSADLVRSVMKSTECEAPFSIDLSDSLEILQSKAREENVENPFEKDSGLSTDRLLLERLDRMKDNKAAIKTDDEIIEFAKLRADARQQVKVSFRNVVREVRSESETCKITDGPDLLEEWRRMPDNPYKMIMASYLVAASDYPQEAILLLIKYMDEKSQKCFPSVSPGSDDSGDDTGRTVVKIMLRTRMLQVLNAMMEYTENYGQLVVILDEIAKDYKEWLSEWGMDGDIAETEGMERVCEQREEYAGRAEFPQRYVAAYLNAKTRLVYFLGRYEAKMLEESYWRQLAAETTEELLSYALSEDPLERFGIKKKGIAKCFPYPVDAYPSDWSKFRRDALLAAAYGKVALARLTEEDRGEDPRAAASLREARLALLDAKQLTVELSAEESKENDKVAGGSDTHQKLGIHQKLVVAIDTEKRNLSEITELLDRLKSF